MRVYVSSTFDDLREHRTACIRVLRQLGHEVVSMEDYVAESSIPLAKVVQDVRRCELYVVLVAWRYGYIPPKDRATVEVKDAVKGQTSITEYEYLAATEAGVNRLAFLLQDRAPWPPHLMDGFGLTQSGGEGPAKVLAFRARVQRDQMVAYFQEPADLEARLSAAVASVGLRRQMLGNTAEQHAGTLGAIAAELPMSDSGRMPLEELVRAAPAPEVAVIDISTTWWSTRLYFLAVVGELLGNLRRVLIRDGTQFVGIVSTQHVRAMLRNLHAELDTFEKKHAGKELPRDPSLALTELLNRWRSTLGNKNDEIAKEREIQITATRTNLSQWFGDGMLSSGITVDNPDETTVLDLVRVLDYPNDFVPVLADSRTQGEPDETAPTIRVINKATLNAQLAKTHLDDMLTNLGLRQGD